MNRGCNHFWHTAKCLLWLGLWMTLEAGAAARQFSLDGVPIVLEDVSAGTDVFFQAMRFNPALRVWNVDVTLRNKSDGTFTGPLVLSVETFTGTTGPQSPDGFDGAQTGRAFYDFSRALTNGALASKGASLPRTLSLGFRPGDTPRLTVKVFATPASTGAAALVRTLDNAGQPLGGVTVGIISGISSGATLLTDPAYGLATVTGAGEAVVRFSADGFLPVWRLHHFGTDGIVQEIPSPRLTRRGPDVVTLTPLGGGTVGSGPVRAVFPPGAVSIDTVATLTPLSAQTLPAFLPRGWSPLAAFWLELPGAAGVGVALTVIPWGPFNPGEPGALVQWNPAALRWEVRQVVTGAGLAPVTAALAGDGAYALVVADGAPTAPPAPVPGQPLPASAAPLPAPADLSATGALDPVSSLASKNPAAVTSTATVTVSNRAGALPSGVLFRGEVEEEYRLRDGTHRRTPPYEHFVTGYQRPGGLPSNTLHAVFPIRPLRLLGADELQEAVIKVAVFNPSAFQGVLLGTNGGQVSLGGVRLRAGAGDLDTPQAAFLRPFGLTNTKDLHAGTLTVVGAFDLSIGPLGPGRRLVPQVDGVPANARLVLARVLQEQGLYGLEPVERLASDAQGRLTSLETNTTDRLPGVARAGQYVLVQVAEPQTLVQGIARNAQGQPAGGMLVRLAPWMALSRSPDGTFQLLARTGTNQLGLTDLRTGDGAAVGLEVPVQPGVLNTTITAGASGLGVVSVSPADNATSVPRVTAITVTFNKPLNPAGLLDHTFQLIGTNAQPVTASVALNLAGTVATLLPSTPLEAAQRYLLVLSTNLSDPLGRRLEGPNTFAFTTAALPGRDAAAQLIIYEPGATNVPAAVLARIPGYVPGTNRTAIVVRGTPGVADPKVAVILANESSGETATVLSLADGSFNSVIGGAEEDFVSATFVNLNGTRVYIPVSRQLFDNGFVGLYRTGGILEAQSDGGPVQVILQPEAVPTRTKFRLKPITPAQLREQLGGVEPDVAQVAGGALTLETAGPAPTGGIKVSMPLNLLTLGYPTNEPATNAALALALVSNEQGVKTFEVLDRMTFTPRSPFGLFAASGRPGPSALRPSTQRRPAAPADEELYNGVMETLVQLAPAAGITDPLFKYVFVPLFLGTKPVVVKGRVGALRAEVNVAADTLQGTVGTVGTVANGAAGVALQGGGLAVSLLQRSAAKPLSGAFIILRRLPNVTLTRPGRLEPGMIHATSGSDGRYLMVSPSASDANILTATHPRFQERLNEPMIGLFELGLAGAVIKNFFFEIPLNSETPPRVLIAHSPLSPAPGQDCTIQVSATQGIDVPPTLSVFIQSVTDLVTSSNLPLTLVKLTPPNGSVSKTGNRSEWTATLTTTNAVAVVLGVLAVNANNLSLPRVEHLINFAGPLLPPNDAQIPPSDPADKRGPAVISSSPPEGGNVGQNGELDFIFDKPIDRSVTNASNLRLTGGPTAVGPPVVRLSADQRSLTLQFFGLAPDSLYVLSLSGPTIRDLNGNPLDQRPSTPAPDSFTMSFHTAPLLTRALPGLVNGRGVALSGDRLYALESGNGNYLVTYDVSNPDAPVTVGRTRVVKTPRDLVVIPHFGYNTTATDFACAA